MSLIRKQSIFGSFIAVFGVILGFLNSGFLQPKILAIETIGLIRVMLSIASVASVFATFGFNTVLVKFFPEAEKNNQARKLLKLYTLTIIAGLILGVTGIYVYLQFIQSKLPEHYFLSTILVFIFYFLLTSFGILLNVFGKVNYVLFVKDVLIKFLFVSFLIALILFDKPEDWLVNSFYGVYMLGALLLLLNTLFVINLKQINSRVQNHEKLNLSKIFPVAFFSLLSASTAIFIKELDILMVTELIDIKATGVYAVMLFFAVLVSVPSRALIGISTVKIGQAWSNNDSKFLTDIYKKTANNQLFIAGLVMVLLNANVYVVLDLMPNGFKFIDGVWVVFWLSLAQFIDMASGVSGQILYYSDKFKVGFYLSVILLICLIGLNYLLIPVYGISGAAFATFLSQLINNFLRWYFLKNTYNLQPFNRSFIIGLIMIGALITIAVLCRPFVQAVDDFLLFILMNFSLLAIFFITIIKTKIAPDLKDRIYMYAKKMKVIK